MEKQAQKDGSRIGQNITSIHKLGGLSFFCRITDFPKGDEKLLENVFIGVNNDKKAKDVAKILLSYDDENKKVLGIAHFPEHMMENNPITLTEWVDYILIECAQKNGLEYQRNMISGTQEKFTITIGHEKELFPFKLCDEIVSKNHILLKEKKLLPVKEDKEDSDDVDYAADMGIEW